MTEFVDIVDEEGRIIGRAERRECHGNPSLIHCVAHIMVFDVKGRILLQLRGWNKRIQPGKWDSSVGGHLSQGESYDQGAARELEEELGIPEAKLTVMYDYLWRSEVETERVRTYHLIHEGPFKRQAEEIEELRFFTPEEVEQGLGNGIFTPNFEEEWARYLDWKSAS